MSLPRHTVGSTENYWMQVSPNAIVSWCTTNGVCDKIFSSVRYSLILFPEKKLIGWLHAHMDKNWRMASAERSCSWEDDIGPRLYSVILWHHSYSYIANFKYWFFKFYSVQMFPHTISNAWLCLSVDTVPSYTPLWWASSELDVLCGGPLPKDLVLQACSWVILKTSHTSYFCSSSWSSTLTLPNPHSPSFRCS